MKQSSEAIIGIFKNYTIKDIVINQYKSLQDHHTIKDAIKMILSTQNKMILIYHKTTMIGVLTKKHIVRALRKDDENASITKYMHKALAFADAGLDLLTARQLLANTAEHILIVKEDNQIIGIIDKDNVDELVSFVTAKKRAINL
ncbi:MAG: CBS domain-containing protein [Sphingobacteriales bacterium]|nr:CBS domain-containing protein [Sphingobacteriales bacterium]